jgi:hypothetical protein
MAGWFGYRESRERTLQYSGQPSQRAFVMRRAAFVLLALGLAAGCRDYAGPSETGSVYALARMGAAHLPVSLNGDGTPPFLVADTLRLIEDRPRPDQQILRRITVIQQGSSSAPARSETDYEYSITGGLLTYIDCPIGALCLASLVYSPRVFQIVRDSLFEVVPAGAGSPPRVYGLVRYR